MIGKSILFVIIVLLFFCCENPNSSQTFEIRGTISYIQLEGSFYGIITDDGKNLDPINLADEYKQNGLKVWLIYKEREDLASYHMWGTLIEIVKIQKSGE